MESRTLRRRGVFISGTDTGIGKTFVSSLLVTALEQFKIDAGYFKPIQTGTDSDCDEVQALSGALDEKIERPVYLFPEPMAPHRAARLCGEVISISQLQDRWAKLSSRTWVVEGAGGLLVPLNSKDTIRELIVALDLPMLLVASTRLGTINHTLLTLEAAARAGVRVLGIVLVGNEDQGLGSALGEITNVPVLAEVPWFPAVSSTLVREIAAEYFAQGKLGQLFPEGSS